MAESVLDRLEALAKAADLGPLQSTHVVSLGYTHLANLTERIGEGAHERGRCVAMMQKEWSDYLAAGMNALPALLKIARAAQAHREVKYNESAKWMETAVALEEALAELEATRG